MRLVKSIEPTQKASIGQRKVLRSFYIHILFEAFLLVAAAALMITDIQVCGRRSFPPFFSQRMFITLCACTQQALPIQMVKIVTSVAFLVMSMSALRGLVNATAKLNSKQRSVSGVCVFLSFCFGLHTTF
jgi:hypothetical protein